MIVIYCILLIPTLIAIWALYILLNIIFDIHNTAYTKDLTLQGYNYYKADGFFIKAIPKSEYVDGKRKEKEKRKERLVIKKQLRNS